MLFIIFSTEKNSLSQEPMVRLEKNYAKNYLKDTD